jgi:transcriptional regulator with XRE-family HTH domain
MKGSLPEREKAICSRLREAREFVGITQTECAKQIGTERGTLVNYESGRTPLRAPMALRFCRTLIISEEWLATGKLDSVQRAAKKHGIGQNSEMNRKIFSRQCMDLFSEPPAARLPHNILFSEAYDSVLAPIYAELVQNFFYQPRIVLHDSDSEYVGYNFLRAMVERWLYILSNESLKSKKQGLVHRSFVRAMYEAGDLIFLKYLGRKVEPQKLQQLEWLRLACTDPNTVLGPLHFPEPKKAEDPSVEFHSV